MRELLAMNLTMEVIAYQRMNRPKRLSATVVNTVNIPGRCGNGRGGHGLSLPMRQGSAGGFSTAWAQRIRLDDKTADVSLGAYLVATLAPLRQKELAKARVVSERHSPSDGASRAVAVLDDARGLSYRSRLVSPSPTRRRLNDSTLDKLRRELGIRAVPHGSCSGFRDWADVPCDVCKLALDRVTNDRSEAAYWHSDLVEGRRGLIADWADYISAWTPVTKEGGS